MAASAYPTWPNLAAMLFARAGEWRDRPALAAHRNGAWRTETWDGLARGGARVAAWLAASGLEPGGRVLLLSENRPEWPMADLGIMAAGGVSVPAFTTWTVEDLRHVLRDCGARLAIAGSEGLAERLTQAAGGMAPGVLILDDAGLPGDAAWEPLAKAAAEIPPERLASLIYTSGTGGQPKGVMLAHRAVLSNCRGAHALCGHLVGPGDVYLSFLPLSHSYERTVGQFLLLSLGAVIHYSRGVEHLAHEMAELRPAIITVVPRLLEVIRGRILAALARQPAWQRSLFQAALAAGLRREDGRAHLLDRLLDPLYERLVRRRVRARFGGRVRGVVSGGARLDPAVGRFFRALGIPLVQGYGQTEAGPVISCSPLERARIATVGPPLEGVEVAFGGDGEILVRGGLVMDGYWNNPVATKDALADGWLHTGDIGALDADGYLTITDRKKDIVVLSGGDNISPLRIEGMLLTDPAIAQAAVFGDDRPYLVAVVVPSEAARHAHADSDALTRGIAAAVDAANRQLSQTERVRRFVVAEAPFSTENGMLTPTLKLRRHRVREKYAAAIDALYG